LTISGGHVQTDFQRITWSLLVWRRRGQFGGGALLLSGVRVKPCDRLPKLRAVRRKARRAVGGESNNARAAARRQSILLAGGLGDRDIHAEGQPCGVLVRE